MRTRGIWRYALAGLVAAVCLGTVSAGDALAAPRSGVKILAFKATPDIPTYSGGTIRLQGTTSGATTCIFSSSATIAGWPKTIPCPGQRPGIDVTIGRNTGSTVKNISFSLKAQNPSGSTWSKATIFVHQLPQPPVIKSFSASAHNFPATGGKVTLTARIARGSGCVYTSSPPLSFPNGGKINCTNDVADTTVTLPATKTGATQPYDIDLVVGNAGGTGFTGSTIVYVLGQKPTVSDFTATPSTLPDTGGTVTLSENVTDAIQCEYGYAWKGGQKNPISTKYMPHTQTCSSGKVIYKVVVSPNKTKLADKITFLLIVASSGGNARPSPKPVVTLAAQP